MKKSSKPDPLTPRPNLDFSKGERGKYSNLLQEGTNVVILDPALLGTFPDLQSVNDALHAFLSMDEQQRRVALEQYRQATGKFTLSEDDYDPRNGGDSGTEPVQ